MKDFIKKYKIILSIAIFAMAVLALIYFAIMPLMQEITAKADEIQQKKIDKELNEKKLASVVSMEDDFGKFKDNENKFSIMIESDKEVDFIKELEALASQTGNRIEFRVDEVAGAKPTAKVKNGEVDIKSKLKYANFLSMQIALEGNYSSLLNFINKLENYENYVNIIMISSEKKIIAESANSNPFAAADRKADNKLEKEIINSILDVVVYIKK